MKINRWTRDYLKNEKNYSHCSNISLTFLPQNQSIISKLEMGNNNKVIPTNLIALKNIVHNHGLHHDMQTFSSQQEQKMCKGHPASTLSPTNILQ